jgi:sulfite oxidase
MTCMAWGMRDDMIVHTAEPLNAEPTRAALAQAELTPADAFYVRNHGPVLEVQPEAWRLRVGGLVSNPLELSLDDLRHGFARHEVAAVLQCAGNRRAGLMQVRDIPGQEPWGPGATGNARWAGARLADVLASAGLRSGARHVAFAAPDVSGLASPPQPFGASIPLHKAMSGEVLLAWEMNGHPLPAVHGGPVRVIVPGYIGARSVKWVGQVSATDQPSDNYFQATDYRLLPAEADPDSAGAGDGFPLGPVAVNADILLPAEGAAVDGPAVTVAGYAVAGDDRRITRVDVSHDGGRTWRQASLGDELSVWSWRRWQATLRLPPGPAEVTARAWDSAANVQPESAAQMWNPKGYINNAWARIRFTVARAAAPAARG